VTQPEFDIHARDYTAMHARSIRASGEEPGYFHDYKISELRSLADLWGLSAPAILDFGSGIGNSVPYFRRYFPDSRVDLADVSPESLKMSADLHGGPEVRVLIGADGHVPLPDGGHDIVFAACVFHHLDPAAHDATLRELRRVVRPGGRLMIFEHNPLNPLTVRAVRDCPFDENAILIRAGEMRGRVTQAGWRGAMIDYHVFFPAALARLRALEPGLRWCPLGAQYACHAQAPAAARA